MAPSRATVRQFANQHGVVWVVCDVYTGVVVGLSFFFVPSFPNVFAILFPIMPV